MWDESAACSAYIWAEATEFLLGKGTDQTVQHVKHCQ